MNGDGNLPFRDAGELRSTLRDAFLHSITLPPGTEPHLARAVRDALCRPGNFVRAQIVYGMATACALPHHAGVELAVAMEYFHTASLLFDDLPAIDDATQRRGGPCIHVLHGEGTAMLVALALINRAYALLWKAVMCGVEESRSRSLDYVETYLGLGGLLNGQSQDLHYGQLPSYERSPQRVAMGKTVALMRLSVVLPAMIGGAGGEVLRLLERLAIVWGLAYQAIDDLKDVIHASDSAGKTTLRDELLDRPNLALKIGTEATLDRLHRMVRMGDRTLNRLPKEAPMLLCLHEPQLLLQGQVRALWRESRQGVEVWAQA